jgi:putative endonuclease
MLAHLTRTALISLDWLAHKLLPPDTSPPRHQIGRRGEEDAYFYLRRQGYTMVARNYRSPHNHGEIDLIGWDNDVLCFIEVKTRTAHDMKPAEAAVNRPKQDDLRAVARDYLRHVDPASPRRFDVVSVYYEQPPARRPAFELFKNAFPVVE